MNLKVICISLSSSYKVSHLSQQPVVNLWQWKCAAMQVDVSNMCIQKSHLISIWNPVGQLQFTKQISTSCAILCNLELLNFIGREHSAIELCNAGGSGEATSSGDRFQQSTAIMFRATMRCIWRSALQCIYWACALCSSALVLKCTAMHLLSLCSW